MFRGGNDRGQVSGIRDQGVVVWCQHWVPASRYGMRWAEFCGNSVCRAGKIAELVGLEAEELAGARFRLKNLMVQAEFSCEMYWYNRTKSEIRRCFVRLLVVFGQDMGRLAGVLRGSTGL